MSVVDNTGIADEFETAVVTPSGLSNEVMTQAIAVPDSITLSDGRKLKLISWKPTVAARAGISVVVEAHIEIPKEWIESDG